MNFCFLDSDNFSLRDPTYLFDYRKEKNVSALFWPDTNSLIINNSVWDEFNGLPSSEYNLQ